MGIGSGICVFLRPSCYGDSERTGRPGSGEKEIGFEIPQAKNPSGLSDRGALSRDRGRATIGAQKRRQVEDRRQGGATSDARNRTVLWGLASRKCHFCCLCDPKNRTVLWGLASRRGCFCCFCDPKNHTALSGLASRRDHFCSFCGPKNCTVLWRLASRRGHFVASATPKSAPYYGD